jgi:hypothetical protein
MTRSGVRPPSIAALRKLGIHRTGAMEYRRDDNRPQSALMLAVRITLLHFSVSLMMSFIKSTCDIDMGAPPEAATGAPAGAESRCGGTAAWSAISWRGSGAGAITWSGPPGAAR